ncbi:hypothetical protein MW887_010548 [Aspergillus wentii]|nr:hypothetical protein MW887_010548 [Aspergillus wentii]
MSPSPYTISVPDSHLQSLHQKLSTATFPDELDNAHWDMGVPLDEIKRLTAFWRHGFDWRKKERQLNEQLAQFTVPVSVSGFGQLDIHFVHHRSQSPRAIPLLFIHGWPGSFLEASKLIPFLTTGDEKQPAFDVVVPSLPNFGFSQGVKKRGFGLAQYAEAMHAVMTSLAIQAGDWGSMIARVMGQFYPQHIKAVHLNFVPVPPPYPWKHPLIFLQSLLTIPFSPKNKAYLSTTRDYMTKGNAYLRQQATRPQTLGYALHDSPVALLAWIYDKLHAWTDDYPWTDEEILTWVSVYFFSAAGPAASLRIYYEAENGGQGEGGLSTAQVMAGYVPESVKLAVAHFSGEIVKLPLLWCSSVGNVVKTSEHEAGGHFAAWEVPELLAGDLRSFFGKQGQAYNAVAGKDGY